MAPRLCVQSDRMAKSTSGRFENTSNVQTGWPDQPIWRPKQWWVGLNRIRFMESHPEDNSTLTGSLDLLDRRLAFMNCRIERERLGNPTFSISRVRSLAPHLSQPRRGVLPVLNRIPLVDKALFAKSFSIQKPTEEKPTIKSEGT